VSLQEGARGYKRTESNAANDSGTKISLPTNRMANARDIPRRTQVVLAYHGNRDSVIAAFGFDFCIVEVFMTFPLFHLL
jgi:hypothetical protein